MDNALTYLNKVVKRHAIVFLISDCLDRGFEKPLRLAAKKHDLTVIRLYDPAENVLPGVGLVCIKDPETGKKIIIDSSNKHFRKRLVEDINNENRKLKDLLSKAGIDLVELSTCGPIVEPLMLLFERKGVR